jgi:hypothetical protein
MLKRISLAALFILVAGLALAVTVAELQAQADALEAAYVVLDSKVDACPNGKCADRDQILATVDSLDAWRAGLHADRASITNCTNCAALDATIAHIDALAVSIAGRVAEWEQSS